MSGESTKEWYFDISRLVDSPSRRHGISQEKEEMYLQQTANFMQEMGRRLSLPLLCINTAVLYTQRFYMFHSVTVFEKFMLGAAALFFAAKVEEHPRKLEHVCQIARNLGFFRKEVNDSEYVEDLLFNENVLMQTLGFDLQVQHPHQHVLRLCQLIQTPKNLSQTAYILATYCLHLTKMCLMYKPAITACLCIHMAYKMNNLEIPISKEGKAWYLYGDTSITPEMLDSLCDDFVETLKRCPEKCKNKTLKTNHENLLKKLTVDKSGLPLVNPSTPVKGTIEKSSAASTSTPGPSSSRIDNLTLSVNSSLSTSLSQETAACSIGDKGEAYSNSPFNISGQVPSTQAYQFLSPATTSAIHAHAGPSFATSKKPIATVSPLPNHSHVTKTGHRVDLSSSTGKIKFPKDHVDGNRKPHQQLSRSSMPPSSSLGSAKQVSLLKPDLRLSALHHQTHSKSALPSHFVKTDASFLENKNVTDRNQSHVSSPTLNLSTLSELTNVTHANYSPVAHYLETTPTARSTMVAQLPSQSAGGLKITIPRSRIQGLESLLLPPRTATPADLKTDKGEPKPDRIPVTASMGSAERSAKRFKPN